MRSGPGPGPAFRDACSLQSAQLAIVKIKSTKRLVCRLHPLCEECLNRISAYLSYAFFYLDSCRHYRDIASGVTHRWRIE